MTPTDLRVTFWGALIMGALANTNGELIIGAMFTFGALAVLILLIYESFKK